jgi:hypothetical protein
MVVDKLIDSPNYVETSLAFRQRQKDLDETLPN